RARRHEEAAGFYREALARGGEPEQLGPVLVQSLLALDQVDAARALMAEYHAKHPTSVPLLTAYSEVLVKQKDRPEAREILTQVLARQPYLVPQGMALAEILWGNDEHEAAAGYLQRIVQVDAKHFASRALLAEYHLRRSEPALALTRLDGALALAPAEPGVRQQLRTLSLAAHGQAIRAALSEGDAARALHHLDRTVEISPEDPQAHAARAQVLAQLGDYGRAADALERLAELQPNNPTVLLSLGDLRQRQGRLDLATRHWAAARDLVASDDEPLRAALDQRLGPSN
ncbi:MAG TPA: tetratricopeptide repeat protein, partial [Candidatus Synoicihabitans sp.]|nr:tetratricopeptide repeat protein [Candidatus Synoicihabitans sp.]